MKRISKSYSVLVQYLLSYMGIAVLSCVLIGVVIFNMFITNLEQAELENNQYRLELAAKDLGVQLEVMSTIAYDIAFNIKYRPLTLEQNSYNEVLLLQDFKKYSNYTPVAETLFLKYHHSDKLFTSAGYTYPSYVYVGQVLGIDGHGALTEFLDNIAKPSVYRAAGTDTVMIAFPVRASHAPEPVQNATLCFVTSEKALLGRINDISGFAKEGLSLRLLGEDVIMPQQAIDGDGALLRAEGDSEVLLTLSLPLVSAYSGIGRFRTINVFAIAMLVLLVVSVACVVAYRNFAPIKRIHARLPKSGSVSIRNELYGIEAGMAQALESNMQAAERISQQMQLVRKQSLKLLLGGDLGVLALFHEIGINFSGDFFSIYEICPRFKGDLDALVPQAATLIEDLSSADSAGLRFWVAAPGQMEASFTVFVSMADEAASSEAHELIQSVLELIEIDFAVGTSQVYGTPAMIKTAVAEAAADCREELDRDINPEGSQNLLCFDTKHLNRMLRSAKSGAYEEASRHLDSFIARMGDEMMSMMMKRYLLSEVAVAVVQTARELKMDINLRLVNAILTVQSWDDLRSVLLRVLDTMTAGQVTPDADVSNNVLAYIREHFAEYDLSLERLSGEFDLSANYLCRLIKQAAGENYKDYVIYLRVEAAKKLLLEGQQVARVGEMVGYANVSHFIRTFKTVAGQTPANYRKTFAEDQHRGKSV